LVSADGRTGPARCVGPVTGQAFVKFPRGQVWRIFLCVEHGSSVDGSQLLDADGAAELVHRRAQTALALAGKPYQRAAPLGRSSPSGAG
jgi:hypothetical protein